jgi:hypothetical protein
VKQKPPVKRVIGVVEVVGPRGGALHVLYLDCGCMTWRRLARGAMPPDKIPCVGCFVKRQLAAVV